MSVPASLAYRSQLKSAHDDLKIRFEADEPIEELVQARAALLDGVLRELWSQQIAESGSTWALVAVGGYGRGELHPASDVDLLVLVAALPDAAERARIERFIGLLWDIGLEVGHSVRTVQECVDESADVGVFTTLLESRRVAGSAALLECLHAALAPEHLWPARAFFEAKVREQTERHLKANDTAYNLEPNVKTGPGGLRDIQTIAWVAQRLFGARSLDALVMHRFLSKSELKRLLQARAFLWKARFALHMLTGRREDRLLFDHQIRLAQLFGYEDASYTLAVEQLMQRYYRTVKDVSFLNELLLQLFRECLAAQSPQGVSGSEAEAASISRPLNARFNLRGDYIEAVNDNVFKRYPAALLELFVLMQQHPQIKGVRAATMRAVARNLNLIDEEFRQNPRHHRLFLEIVRAPVGVTHELRRMNTYGVLGRYIPAFGRVVGRMQYDLFHAYTVDAHTLFVVSNLRRLAITRYDHELPELSRIMQALPKPEIAYLAALFHDIAKGRGGDHSELGAVDAEAFCLEQGLSPYDARLVAWLVRNHLQLSVTAQKQDISDPEVINSFAHKVGDETHLDYLYVLTCADVRGTNPKLWNSWKASLFHEFYERVKRALRSGLESPIDQEQLVRETQDAARRLLAAGAKDMAWDATATHEALPGDAGSSGRFARLSVLATADIERVWAGLPASYFLRHTPEEVAWHTRLLAEREPGSQEPLVALEPRSVRGTTAVLTYAPHRRHGFARTTAVLDQLGLTIVDARITPIDAPAQSAGEPASGQSIDFSLDLYHVLEDDGAPITDADRQHEIEHALWRSLQQPDNARLAVSRRTPRQARMFNTPTHIIVSVDERNRRSVLELTAGDRPGLLCDIGKILMQERIKLHGARITTVGERAEDVFYITDYNNHPLDEAAALRLKEGLIQALGHRQAA